MRAGRRSSFSLALVSLRCCKVDGLHKNVRRDGRGMPRRVAYIYTCSASCLGQLTFKPRRSGTRGGMLRRGEAAQDTRAATLPHVHVRRLQGTRSQARRGGMELYHT